LIIVVSDHGESFMEHGFVAHGTNLYEPEISVPLLIKLPARYAATPPPAASAMQFVDLFPTIMAILGGDIPPNVQGRPWGVGREFAMSEEFCLHRSYERTRRELFAVTMKGWKRILSTDGTEECYDLSKDPGELRNLASCQPDIARLAREALAVRNASLRRSRAGDEPDESLMERLRALGYVK